jgi:hypothetical protein
MSEEQNVETNDGTWSGLKKTIIGAISTAVLAGGTWLTTQLFGGHEEAPAAPVQQAAPIININNTQQQQQSAGGGKTVIIQQAAPAAAQPATQKPAEQPKPKKEFSQEPQW